MLFSRRKRLEELEAREAAGESLWTADFDERVRAKIWFALADIAGDYYQHRVAEHSRAIILRDEGMLYLYRSGIMEAEDFRRHLFACEHGSMPSVVEAIYRGFEEAASDMRNVAAPAQFAQHVKTTLREHRISFDLIEGKMVEFQSRAMHVAVVAPVLSLLAGRRDFSQVESAYQDALGEISDGKPGDAITDAGTAMQETLTALGCTGNALGPLIKSAKANGLLASHDAPMLGAIEKVMHWVSADRSESGDAHAAKLSTVDDAWFIVHVVGAVILRLVQAGGRGS